MPKSIVYGCWRIEVTRGSTWKNVYHPMDLLRPIFFIRHRLLDFNFWFTRWEPWYSLASIAYSLCLRTVVSSCLVIRFSGRLGMVKSSRRTEGQIITWRMRSLLLPVFLVTLNSRILGKLDSMIIYPPIICSRAYRFYVLGLVFDWEPNLFHKVHILSLCWLLRQIMC